MKAVVQVGGKQYIVAEKETLLVDRLQPGTKELTLDALMVFDDKNVTVGTPLVKGASVKAEIVEDDVKGEKIRVIRYKAKKRVDTQTGHRQKYTRIRVTGISTK